jgi:O-antigen ligase
MGSDLTAKKARKSEILLLCLFALLFFAIPIEHKYDKLFRFYSLTLVPDGLTLPLHFDKKIYFYPSDLIALILLGWGPCKLRRGTIFLLLIFALAAVSTMLSPLAHYPLAYIRFWQLLTPFVLFSTLANCTLSKERLFRVISWAFVAAGSLQAVLATWQYMAQHSLGLRLFNEQPLNSVFGTGGVLLFRGMGTLPHPNVLGGFLTVSLLFSGYLFLKHPRWRIGLGALYALQLYALGVTFCRSALFAYLLATLVWFLWVYFRQGLFMRSFALLFTLSISLATLLLHEPYLQRGGVVQYDQGRLDYQQVALGTIQKNPWIGVGYGQYELALHSIPVHNIYLLTATEIGLAALLVLLLWIGTLLFRAYQTISMETGLLFAAFLAFLFIGCCDFYPILFQQGKLLFFGIAGLLVRLSYPNDSTHPSY